MPNIPNKLIKPAKRNSLNAQKLQFWDLVIKEGGPIKCIYTDNNLDVGQYAVEHFIPYSFVTHDLMWNLIPADPRFNSKKSDKLPILDKYFRSFFNIQRKAVEIIKDKYPRNKFLDEYIPMFPDHKLKQTKYLETIQPLITIASNNGFLFMK